MLIPVNTILYHTETKDFVFRVFIGQKLQSYLVPRALALTLIDHIKRQKKLAAIMLQDTEDRQYVWAETSIGSGFERVVPVHPAYNHNQLELLQQFVEGSKTRSHGGILLQVLLDQATNTFKVNIWQRSDGDDLFDKKLSTPLEETFVQGISKTYIPVSAIQFENYKGEKA